MLKNMCHGGHLKKTMVRTTLYIAAVGVNMALETHLTPWRTF